MDESRATIANESEAVRKKRVAQRRPPDAQNLTATSHTTQQR